MKRVVAFTLLVVLAVGLLCLGASETLTNRTGKTASGVVITFSESVRISSYNESIFPNQSPSGRADQFTFSGGTLANGSRFKVTWSPNSAEIVSEHWVTTVGGSVEAPIAGPCSLCDDFGGTQLDTCKWADTSGMWRGARVSQDGALILSTSGDYDYSDPQVTGQYQLLGDFSIEVSWRITAGWQAAIRPAGAGVHSDGAAVCLYVNQATWVQISRTRHPDRETVEAYASTGGLLGSVPCSATTGAFRVVRETGRVSFYYNVGQGWQYLCSASSFPAAAYPRLSAVSAQSHHAFVTEFDDFRLVEGATSYVALDWVDSFVPSADFMVGAAIETLLGKRVWDQFWRDLDPLQVMKDNGLTWIRTPVQMRSSEYLRNTPYSQWPSLPWRSEYWCSLEWAERILREGADHGLRLNLQLVLSDQTAHRRIQEAPAEWKGLSLERTADLLEQYGYDTARYFKERGIPIEIYDVGNEIELGILNFRPGERISVPAGVDPNQDDSWMRENVWKPEAFLLKHAIAGIKRANPSVKITLHIAACFDLYPNQAYPFFKAMTDFGVEFDYAGLSLTYPTIDSDWPANRYSSKCWWRHILATVDAVTSLGKRVMISEGSYPNDPTGVQQSPMPDYPYTPKGQAAWVHDVLRFARNASNVLGFFYWDVDLFPGIFHETTVTPEEHYGLFGSDSQIFPAMREFNANLSSASPTDHRNAIPGQEGELAGNDFPLPVLETVPAAFVSSTASLPEATELQQSVQTAQVTSNAVRVTLGQGLHGAEDWNGKVLVSDWWTNLLYAVDLTTRSAQMIRVLSYHIRDIAVDGDVLYTSLTLDRTGVVRYGLASGGADAVRFGTALGFTDPELRGIEVDGDTLYLLGIGGSGQQLVVCNLANGTLESTFVIPPEYQRSNLSGLEAYDGHLYTLDCGGGVIFSLDLTSEGLRMRPFLDLGSCVPPRERGSGGFCGFDFGATQIYVTSMDRDGTASYLHVLGYPAP